MAAPAAQRGGFCPGEGPGREGARHIMDILSFMKEQLLFLDGGMGTLLQERGLAPGELPERWNLTHASEIAAIHRAYYEAGSHVVLTNTFGANRLKYRPEELVDIVRAGVACAQEARSSSAGPGPRFIGLDIGPTGKLLRPFGTLDFEEAVSLFGETVRIGAEAGVDLIFIETMNDIYEAKAALLAARENCDLPVFVSCAYGEDGKLMTGATPEAAVAVLEGLGADAVGVNCSFGPDRLSEVVSEYLRVASIPVFFKPNAGLPSVREGKTVYDLSPADFAAAVTEQIRKGVRAAGGCCGTTPDYLRALRAAAAGLAPVPLTDKGRTCIASYTHAVCFGDRPVLIGERINPTGKKAFRAALLAGDMTYILQEGIRQQEQGAEVLDVNVGLPDIDERDWLVRTVCALQGVCNLPLQLDTADPVAMEAALRCYNGKALINSVNGKEESMRAVFPLAAKYGGVVVALTLDEAGIPETAEGRVAIARRILARAAAYGIAAKDLIFDPLCMAVSADPHAATVTLESVARIRAELGCPVSLGVSNVSFGLPRREMINSTFFAAALDRGLSAAIMNPYSAEMMRTYRAHCALHGLDENCADYIAYASSCPVSEQTPPAPAGGTPATAAGSPVQQGTGPAQEHKREAHSSVGLPAAGAGAPAGAGGSDADPPLLRAVLRGMKEEAARLSGELLRAYETVPQAEGEPADATPAPLRLVQEQIIPALDRVGQGYESGRIFLPQLLMSAEAAKAAFVQVREAMQRDASGLRLRQETIVIATVHGDIHDIGKNIVRLLLENYGFRVVDLGRDVPPERVVEEVVARHAEIAALSALMTTTVPAMAETIRKLRASAPWCRIMVGGAVMNEAYAAQIGADLYTRDATEAVRGAEALCRELSEAT